MKRFLLPATLVAALLSMPGLVRAQTTGSRPAANTSVAPATRPTTPDDGWYTPETWAAPAAPAASGWETAATPAPDADPMMRSSGVLVAPGMSSSPYRGTSTDYHGRPVAKAKSKRPRSVEVAQQDDPMMRSSGVMLAPGMNTAPYRGTSTDYNGRPVRKPEAATSAAAVAAQPAPEDPMAASW